jgi:hypothetical protein
MGLFSEMLPARKIKESLTEAGKVLMITCPGCACESLSYSEGLPCRALARGKNLEQSAIAVHRVRDRWDEIVRDMGKTTRHVTIAFPCEMFDTDRENIFAALDDGGNPADTVAALACSSGFAAIRELLKGLNVRIVPMMKTTGTFIFRLVPSASAEESVVDREGARITRFSALYGGGE